MGSRFCAERERIGLSRNQLAELACVTAVQIGRIERDQSKPGAEILSGMAAAGADVSYILLGRRAGADPQRLSVICHAIEAAVEERFGAKGHCNPRMLGLIYNQVLAKGRSADDDVDLAKEEVVKFLESLSALEIPAEQLAKKILRQEAPDSDGAKAVRVVGSGNQVAGRNLSGTQINRGSKK